MKKIAERLQRISQTLRQTAHTANRAPDSIELLAVSKTKPVSDIVHAYEAGQRKFGENYVQEGVEKIESLQQLPDIEWHFIGPLQSNKTRLVASHFDWVQSVDREKIARRLNDQRSAHKPLNVCIQVNINHESSKSGVLPDQVATLAQLISALPNLTLRGLMTIPAANQSDAQLQKTFSTMHELFVKLQSQYPEVDTLSMGMSDDLEVAVKCGTTMVRLGTAIFGPRN